MLKVSSLFLSRCLKHIVSFSTEVGLCGQTECILKSLQVGIIGLPNAGKSTLINQLIGQQICATSCKVHTTRFKARAILNEGNCEIVFTDTPGLVEERQAKSHHLEPSFLLDGNQTAKESDVICLIHDASNKWTRDSLDRRVVKLLDSHRNKKTVLVLNKVDLMKSKRKILDLVHIFQESFEEIFMVSALTGSGLPELKDYLLAIAPVRQWMYPADLHYDQSMETLVVQAVQASLLNNLNEEIPYEIKLQLEHLHVSRESTITAVVLVGCSTSRIERMVLGAKGWKIRTIAQSAEQQLQSAFNTTVMLKLVVTTKSQ